MGYCFGVDIGGTTVKLGLFTTDGELLDKWEITSDRSNHGANVPADIAASVLGKIDEKGLDKSQIRGIGLGVPGPVTSDGTVVKCPNLGWDIFNVNEKMTQLTGIASFAANDANVAALGELWQGGAKGFKNMVFVTLGTGVGGGIVVNGKMIFGTHGGGGEIGHICVNPLETDVCGCGCRGHLEQYASATGIVRITRKKLSGGAVSVLKDDETLTAKAIFDAAREGDALALESVDVMCAYMAQAFSGIAATADPEVFLIGGGVSRAGEIITDTVRKFYVPSNMNVLRNVEFKLATLGNDAGIYGAAYHALTSVQ